LEAKQKKLEIEHEKAIQEQMRLQAIQKAEDE
jgi:hypothetical protein